MFASSLNIGITSEMVGLRIHTDDTSALLERDELHGQRAMVSWQAEGAGRMDPQQRFGRKCDRYFLAAVHSHCVSIHDDDIRRERCVVGQSEFQLNDVF